jgi:hypothetical protein
MQTLRWVLLRAATKVGMAIAASRPMMVHTIRISTNVCESGLYRKRFGVVGSSA